MPGKKNILIVDDSAINRRFLTSILENDYYTIQAENGEMALEILHECSDSISLIMLDIYMPIMDGFAFLEEIKSQEEISAIPVIVTTSSTDSEDEVKCLKAGAAYCITKPYNPEIVLHRIASVLRLQEKSSLLNLLKYDSITGVYGKDFFHKSVKNILQKYPEKKFDIVCVDIIHFKFVNERYGTTKGNELLHHLASKLPSLSNNVILCGRIGADTFAILQERKEYDHIECQKRIEECLTDAPVPDISLKFGIYKIYNNEIEISVMCDRALLALNSIKHKYNINFAVFDDNIRNALAKEQIVINNMNSSLENNDFYVYLQPKHNAKTLEISGAEALVRWNHPVLGFIAPSEFIPVFEKNGFIYNLDLYVWEKVCMTINEWTKSGKTVVPISVNISRIDFSDLRLAEKIEKIADKYQVTHNMLHLEITESAYTENPEQIISTIETLRDKDFVIEMDDFGSGYSSLNMLSALPIDIIKLDKLFIQKGISATNNNKNVLSFIISLSKWLDLPTVVEGVETENEFMKLRSMGCNYIQGYYFARPMPIAEFESYLNDGAIEKQSSQAVSSYTDSLIDYKKSLQNKSTILVVEENEENREALKYSLDPFFDVIIKDSKQSALEYLQTDFDKISVILLDLLVPTTEGFALLEKIHDVSQFAKIPVVVTSDTDESNELQAIRLGAEFYISKPFESEILINRINFASEIFKMRNTTEKLEEQHFVLTKKVFYDDLTQLYNRRGLYKCIRKFENDETNTLILLNIDNMKKYNSKFDHNHGDLLIRKIAEELKKIISADDIASRIDGDSFIIILRHINDAPTALMIGKRICKAIERSNLSTKAYRVTCSAGVALMNGKMIDEAYTNACKALFRSKHGLIGSCHLYGSDEETTLSSANII